MRNETTYERFASSSKKNRRLLRQEELILQAATMLSELLELAGITKVELAERMGVTKGFVTQLLAGDKNLTLRTIADVADALGCKLELRLVTPARTAAAPAARRLAAAAR